MEEASFRYAVVAAKPDQLKPAEIARALSVVRGVPLQDAARSARGVWGIIEEQLSKEAAERLAERLRQESVESLVLPNNLLEEPPVAAAANGAAFSAGQIELQLKEGPRETFALDAFKLVAAAGIKQTIVTTIKVKEGPSAAQRAVSMGLMMAGLPLPIGGKSREVEKKKESTDLFFYLDLVSRSPARRFRIDAQDFNFACLKARMGYTVPQNFRTLVLELIRLCPQAEKNRGTRILFEGAPVATMGYDTLADLDREIRWLLTLDSLKNP